MAIGPFEKGLIALKASVESTSQFRYIEAERILFGLVRLPLPKTISNEEEKDMFLQMLAQLKILHDIISVAKRQANLSDRTGYETAFLRSFYLAHRYQF